MHKLFIREPYNIFLSRSLEKIGGINDTNIINKGGIQ